MLFQTVFQNTLFVFIGLYFAVQLFKLGAGFEFFGLGRGLGFFLLFAQNRGLFPFVAHLFFHITRVFFGGFGVRNSIFHVRIDLALVFSQCFAAHDEKI